MRVIEDTSYRIEALTRQEMMLIYDALDHLERYGQHLWRNMIPDTKRVLNEAIWPER
jgi:hypothetical protein